MTEKFIPFISKKKLTVLYQEDDIFENCYSMLVNTDARIPCPRKSDDETMNSLVNYMEGISPECLMFITCPILSNDKLMLDLMRHKGYQKIYVFCRNIKEAEICKRIGAFLYERMYGVKEATNDDNNANSGTVKPDKASLLIPIDPSNCFDYIPTRGLTGAFIATDLVAYTFYNDLTNKDNDKLMADVDTRRRRMERFIDNCNNFALSQQSVIDTLCESDDGLNMYENIGLVGKMFYGTMEKNVLLSRKYHTKVVDNSEVIEDNELRQTEILYPFPSAKLATQIASAEKSDRVVFKWNTHDGGVRSEIYDYDSSKGYAEKSIGLSDD